MSRSNKLQQPGRFTSLCAARAAPVVSPKPVTTFTTPAGTPASVIIPASFSAIRAGPRPAGHIAGHAQELDGLAGTGAHLRRAQNPGELFPQAVGGQAGPRREQAGADADDQPPAAG